MQSNHLPDTPWHIGYAKKKDNDPRRHKSRCIHLEEGICHARGIRCPGSAHCTSYCENDEENYQSISYSIVHSNEVWFSEEIRNFCANRANKDRQKFLKNIYQCLICKNTLQDYKPIPFLAKYCKRCNVIFVNEDVYTTYTADVNKNISNTLLCLVGLTPPRTNNSPAVSVKKKKNNTDKFTKTQAQKNKGHIDVEKRVQNIYWDYKKGMSYSDLSQKYNLLATTCREICQKEQKKVDLRNNEIFIALSAVRSTSSHIIKIMDMLSDYGIYTVEQFLALTPDKYEKYRKYKPTMTRIIQCAQEYIRRKAITSTYKNIEQI